MRTWAGLLVVGTLSMSACGAGDDAASDPNADRTSAEPTNAPSVQEVDQALQDLDAAVQDYLAVGEQYAPLPRDPAQQSAFFDENDSRLSVARSAFMSWNDLLERALDGGTEFPPYQPADGLREYRDAFGSWISAQEEQARLTRGCFTDHTETQTQADCFSAMLAENEDRWNSSAERLRQLARELEAR